jgi:hypothetical protein
MVDVGDSVWYIEQEVIAVIQNVLGPEEKPTIVVGYVDHHSGEPVNGVVLGPEEYSIL